MDKPERPKLKRLAGGRALPEQAVDIPSAPCFVARAATQSRAGDRRQSKIGGLPYFPDGEAWPACKGCGAPLTFLAQFKSADAPGMIAAPARMLVMFYCFACAPFWDVEGRGFWAMLTPFEPFAPLLPEKKMPIDPHTPPELALRFAKTKDHPAPTEWPASGGLSDWERNELAARRPNVAKTKLGGFPSWCQSPDAPRCRECGQAMRFIGQLVSDIGLGLHFPDGGRLYLFECLAPHDGEVPLSIVMQTE
ncbi:MAG: DUF1963 domain-containing protein [Myxococcales bacterium]|nr:MAG: DUF1963 domain-containing protein [Myxococcales bacterium]